MYIVVVPPYNETMGYPEAFSSTFPLLWWLTENVGFRLTVSSPVHFDICITNLLHIIIDLTDNYGY